MGMAYYTGKISLRCGVMGTREDGHGHDQIAAFQAMA